LFGGVDGEKDVKAVNYNDMYIKENGKRSICQIVDV